MTECAPAPDILAPSNAIDGLHGLRARWVHVAVAGGRAFRA